MGYLICEKCGGYYELQRGEHPEDFDICDCGGKLKYERDFIDEDKYSTSSLEKGLGIKLPPLSKSLKTLGLGIVAIIVLAAKFLPALAGFLIHFTPIQNFNQFGPYYLISALIIISAIVSRIFRFH